jgi:hypothetical protein
MSSRRDDCGCAVPASPTTVTRLVSGTRRAILRKPG